MKEQLINKLAELFRAASTPMNTTEIKAASDSFMIDTIRYTAIIKAP